MRGLFDWFCEHPEELPADEVGGPTQADRVTDYLAGMTDRFAIRAWTERAVPQGLLALDAALHRRLARAGPRRGRLRRARRRAHGAAPGRARRYTGLCPFHDERTPSFGIDPVEKLYHCFGCGEGGDVFKFVMETEGLDFAAALESLADRAGVELERRGRGPARPPSAATARAACSPCSSGPPPTTCACCGSRDEAADAREYLLGRGLSEGALRAVPRRLLAERLGHGAARLAAGGLRGRGAARGRAGHPRARGADLRPLPRADHVPAGRPPRARARLRRAGAARRPGAEVPELARGRGLPQGPPAVRRRPRARRGGEGRRGGPRRGLHRRDRAAPGGLRQRGGLDGHGADRRAGARARQPRAVVLLCLDADAAGRQAAVRAASVLPAGSSCASCRCPPGSDPADLVGAGGRRRADARAARRAPCRSRASRSSGRSSARSAPTPGARPRARARSRP